MSGLTGATEKQMLEDLLQEISAGAFAERPRTERLIRSFAAYQKKNGSLTVDQARVLGDIHQEEFRR